MNGVDLACAYCGRPLLAGEPFSLGNAGRYHLTCTQSPGVKEMEISKSEPRSSRSFERRRPVCSVVGRECEELRRWRAAGEKFVPWIDAMLSSLGDHEIARELATLQHEIVDLTNRQECLTEEEDNRERANIHRNTFHPFSDGAPTK